MLRTLQALPRQADWLAPLLAGFVTVLVGYTSSAAVVFEAARALGANSAQIASWLLALGVGMGVGALYLSIKYRAPINVAWSTPGAALLIAAAGDVSLAQATGAFLFSALLIWLCGVTGVFARLLEVIPQSLGAALLAGILLQFTLHAFELLPQAWTLLLPMLAVYLLMRRLQPRYAVVFSFAVGVLLSASQGTLRSELLSIQLATPVWVTPEFAWPVLLGVGLPLFLVTMASQNLPGVAALRGGGYPVPVSSLISTTGGLNLLLAPFGAFSLNLSAITAALCISPDAHPDPRKRYLASSFAGVLYLLLGVLGASVGALFMAFPRELVLGIAGIALLGSVGNGLHQALVDERQREPALLTFVVTASGVSLWGIGAAFWGIVLGALALLIQRR
ncbi:benzoate/H(+) symporter BenE family transporter [Atopomonas sediminilitoris]|uniref:benzoate/H(+) symporter BenE family transporter n=1 Tax=Atopomonas sediminilitoris TaxID=2919919 RepID=UPI001F4EBE6B|nr:benzoate/H(+) symporter BenE family transporter [Atopomonas sediminilitoris]MCJ8169399.1 benzoate/H(+) symporter BenE family transporter [Atopomonas sediminilitoris]